MQLILEEHVLKKFQLDPYRMVGVEGLFGFAYIWVIIFAMSYVPCPSELMCDLGGVLEDPINGMVQVFANCKNFLLVKK